MVVIRGIVLFGTGNMRQGCKLIVFNTLLALQKPFTTVVTLNPRNPFISLHYTRIKHFGPFMT